LRFIAFILAAALCLAPASAADVYRVQSDTNVLTMSAYDVVATAEWSDNEISQVLTSLNNIFNSVSNIEDDTGWLYTDLHAMRTVLNNLYDRFGYVSGSSLAADFDVLLDNLGFQNWSLSLREVLTGNRVYGYSLMDYLSMANAADTAFKSSFDSWVTDWRVNAASSYLFLRQTNFDILSRDGNLYSVPYPFSIVDVLSEGLLGLGYMFRIPSNELLLGVYGESYYTDRPISLAYILRDSFLGLSANIKSISTGSYTVPLFMSDTGEDYTPTAMTMGAMLNLYLQRMQRDMGQMAFIYADEETIQAKKDAAENEKAATDGFLKPGGPGSLSASDITSAAGAVGSAKDMLSTGVTPGQAFEQLQGSGPLEFFTSVTASNLNTVPATASDLEDDDFVHFYDPSNSEFFELIGKGGG